MGRLRYAVHAYAWTDSWSNRTLSIIDRAASLGFDLIEIPLMELEGVDPSSIKKRLRDCAIGAVVSTVCDEKRDPTGEDEQTRREGIDYLTACVYKAAEIGSSLLSGVIYSAIGRRIDCIPGDVYWERAAESLKEVSLSAQGCGVDIGIEPINRYESFLVNTAAQGLRLLRMIDEPNVKLHLDSYHMNIEEENFYDPTRKSAPFLCHYHLSESHRGTVGTGTVNWDDVFRGLADGRYEGVVGMESFAEVSSSMAAGTCIWRKLAEDTEKSLAAGLSFLKRLEKRYYG